MKKIFTLFNVLIITHLTFAQGILFEQNIETAFQQAKVTNKLVFVECYLPTCPVCASLEPTLKNVEVGQFYNKNFASFKLNGSDINQVKFLNARNIYLPGFPIFLYFDKDKNLLYLADGEKSPESFIAKAKNAIDPQNQATSFKKRFNDGERNIDLLINYGYFSRITNDTTANYKVVEALYDIYPKDQLSSETSWVITKKMVLDIDNGFAQYWFSHMDIAKSYEGEHHPDAEKNALSGIIQYSLYSQRGMHYSSAQIVKIKDYMAKVGAGQYAEGATWQHEARALFREGQGDKALSIVNQISAQFASNGQSLVYLVQYLNANAKDTKYISSAEGFLKKAKPLLKTDRDLAELNYVSAIMHQKAGDVVMAKTAASEAKKLAILAKTAAKDLKKFDDLLGNLK